MGDVDLSNLNELRTELKLRADAAKFELSTEEREDYDGEVYVRHNLSLPNGKEQRSVPLESDKEIKRVLACDFEKFSFLGAYEAVCNFTSGTIEAQVSSHEQVGTSIALRRLKLHTINEDGTRGIGSFQCTNGEGLTITIGAASADFRALLGRRVSRLPIISIRIEGLKISRHDLALKSLETFANSVFFQLDLQFGAPLSLQEKRSRRRINRNPFRKADRTSSSLEFPRFEYDHAPISLYWYARSATRMPLLQFLAFYQVVEFYFPTFSSMEAVRRVRQVLKHPTFRAEHDTDLTKLVASISSTNRNGFGSERSQMLATIEEVLSEEELVSFLDENSEIAELVGSRQNGISQTTLNLAKKNTDHRKDLAELLYEIRCRIVHTKNEGETNKSEMILPFSEAERNLWPNIELMQFVAQKVLIRSSSSFSA